MRGLAPGPPSTPSLSPLVLERCLILGDRFVLVLRFLSNESYVDCQTHAAREPARALKGEPPPPRSTTGGW